LEARVRPARAEDKESLMSFIKHVWGGHDYIPYVWDEWLAGKGGKMFVVEADGVAVGMNRLRFLDDGAAWFEGARVHPDFRGRGLASMLADNGVRVAKERGARVFRLASGSRNRIAHRQIARVKFKEVSRYSVYEPHGKSRLHPTDDARKARPSDLGRMMKLIRASKEYRLGEGIYWHGIAGTTLLPEVVKRLIAKGSVWVYNRAVAVTGEAVEGTELWEEVGFVGGPQEDCWRLVRSLIGRNPKARRRWVFIPQGSPFITTLRQRGWRRNWAMVLFERRAAKG
jgi:GNAT superfamily N-acetyltransferase